MTEVAFVGSNFEGRKRIEKFMRISRAARGKDLLPSAIFLRILSTLP
jgi:hypothetical protein